MASAQGWLWPENTHRGWDPATQQQNGWVPESWNNHKMHEIGSSVCLQRALMGGKQGCSPQPTGDILQLSATMATDQDTFVSAHKGSKTQNTKCLFFAVRNTSLCQTDDGMFRVILPAKIASGLIHVSCRGRSRGASPGSRAAGTTSTGRRWEWQGRVSMNTEESRRDMEILSCRSHHGNIKGQFMHFERKWLSCNREKC